MLHDQQSRSVSPGPSVARSAAFTRQESHSSTVISSTVKYLFRTEVHTFAFSVAANAILSFFPFVLLLMMLIALLTTHVSWNTLEGSCVVDLYRAPEVYVPAAHVVLSFFHLG